MSRSADFCGDRLRLSAFLRVLGDGMPPRPTRCRRRLPLTNDSSELPDQYDISPEVPVLPEAAIAGQPKKLSIAINSSPLSPYDSASTQGNVLTASTYCQEDQGTNPLHAPSRFANSLFTEREGALPCKIPAKVAKNRRKRRLPVHQLALLRTTSSDGLPEPSVRALCEEHMS